MNSGWVRWASVRELSACFCVILVGLVWTGLVKVGNGVKDGHGNGVIMWIGLG